MGKIEIRKPQEIKIIEPLRDLTKLNYSKFQIDIPGMGRLRTGEKHPDFHIVRLVNTENVSVGEEEPKIEEVVKGN